MFNIICVTNRKLACRDFLEQIELVCKASPDAVILREKDLDDIEFEYLARDVQAICRSYSVDFIINSYWNVAITLGVKKIHLPVETFMKLSTEDKAVFEYIGVSCHTLEEAKLAERNGASYIIAGHVFATDCKKGLEPRGVNFIEDICEAVSIPVYGIGGINKENVAVIKSANASGCCIMSGLMKSGNPKKYIEEMRNAI